MYTRQPIQNPNLLETWHSCIDYHLWQLEEYRLLIPALKFRKMSMPRFTFSVHQYLSKEVPAFLSRARQFCPADSLSPLEEKLTAVRREVYPLRLTPPSD